jgi:antitoxin YefM
MLILDYSQFKENMKLYFDMVTEHSESILIEGKDNKNVVVLSEEIYNNLIENIHVFGNNYNYEWLMESKAQLENCD